MGNSYCLVKCGSGPAKSGNYIFAPGARKEVLLKKVSTDKPDPASRSVICYQTLYNSKNPVLSFNEPLLLRVPYRLININPLLDVLGREKAFGLNPRKLNFLDIIFCSFLEKEGAGRAKGFIVDPYDKSSPYYFGPQEMLKMDEQAEAGFLSNPMNTIFINAFTGQNPPGPLSSVECIKTMLYFMAYLSKTESSSKEKDTFASQVEKAGETLLTEDIRAKSLLPHWFPERKNLVINYRSN